MIYTGMLPIPMHPHWKSSRHMCTTTHIPITHMRKGILTHHDHSTICSHFWIIQLQSASIEYLPSTGMPSVSFFFFTSSSPPCLLPHHALQPLHKVCIKSHRAALSMHQFRLLDRFPTVHSEQVNPTRLMPHGVCSKTPSGDQHRHMYRSLSL